MEQPQWKFFLADSDDFSVNADITNQSRNKQLDLSYNRPGSFTFNVNLTSNNLDYTQTNKKCVLCLKNDVIVWSGPIWSRSIDLVEEKIECEAVGWFEILMHRYIIPNVSVPTYTNQGEGSIALALLAYANAQQSTWITAGSNNTTTLRTLATEAWQSIGEEIINLSDMEDGFDMKVDPITRELDIFEWSTSYSDRVNIPFAFNAGVDNISKVKVDTKGGDMRNDVYAVGADNLVSHAVSTSGSKTDNNMLQGIIQATEISNSDALGAIAESEIALKDYPPLEFEIELKPTGQGNPYSIFEDYNIGDKIYIQIRKTLTAFNGSLENIEISGNARIFGASISIDENSTERINSLKTTYNG